jgi:hypothetical protein
VLGDGVQGAGILHLELETLIGQGPLNNDLDALVQVLGI